MSSRTQGAHPAPEELDLLLEGDAEARAELGEHVASCPDCRQVLASLREVRELLRAERSRAPAAPSDLEDRIAAALAGAAAPAAGPAPGAPAGAGRVVPLERRTAGLPRWVAAAAGVVVLGGAALTATQLLGDPDTATEQESESAAGAAAEATPESAAGAAAAARVTATGTDYGPGRVEEQVRDLVAADDLASAPDAAGEATGSSRLTDPAGLAGCLAALGAEPAAPAVVDLATWQGREVAVIVLDGESRHTVWIVERGCRPGADGLVHYQAVPD